MKLMWAIICNCIVGYQGSRHENWQNVNEKSKGLIYNKSLDHVDENTIWKTCTNGNKLLNMH